MDDEKKLYCLEADQFCDFLDEENFEELDCNGMCTYCTRCVVD